MSLCSALCIPVLILKSYCSSTKHCGSLGQRDLLLSGLCWGWHICVSDCFSFQSEQSDTVPHTLISGTAIANIIGGNAEADSVIEAKRHRFPLQPDLVRETSSSWCRLGAPLCPGFLPRLQAGCLLGLRWSTGRLWKQTKHVCVLHMVMWLCVAKHTATPGRPAPACASTKHVQLWCELDIVKKLCFTQGWYTQFTKASPSAFQPLR